MVGFLAKRLIKDHENVKEPRVRQSYGILCGTIGICLNIFLFAGKFLAGSVTKSISITADAFNNLSDAGSSFVTLAGFKMAGAKPDMGHPFGHGRIEYIAGLVVSGVILIMAFELVKSSVEKIIHPQPVEYTVFAMVILLVSILVKLYMYSYNRAVAKKLDSAAVRAVALDSLSDSCATAVVFFAALAGKLAGLPLDGYCGVLVGLFIFYAGIKAAKETLDPLLGQAPEPEFVEQVEKLVLSHEEVCGIHDLIVHDYGPGRRFLSVHAEVPADGDILKLHEVIDHIEVSLQKELKCAAVIHMDPVVTSDERVLELKGQITRILQNVDASITMHDFRVVPGTARTNLIFDMVVPYGFRLDDDETAQTVQEQVRGSLGEEYFCIIQVDKAYKGG
ncbi:MAG: cation transporter [Lachnospiraceae bacterium]|nr:cation transporter [Lachnospiraceae bacterium]